MNQLAKKRTRVYKPEMLKQDKIDGGLKKAFSGLKDKKQSENKTPKSNKQDGDKPFSWNPQPMNIPQGKGNQGTKINIPNYWSPNKKQEQDDEEEQPYWSAEEWEAWALELFDNYPDYRKVLPEWFVEAASE